MKTLCLKRTRHFDFLKFSDSRQIRLTNSSNTYEVKIFGKVSPIVLYDDVMICCLPYCCNTTSLWCQLIRHNRTTQGCGEIQQQEYASQIICTTANLSLTQFCDAKASTSQLEIDSFQLQPTMTSYSILHLVKIHCLQFNPSCLLQLG